MRRAIDSQTIHAAVTTLGIATRAQICWHLGTNDRGVVGLAMTDAQRDGLIQSVPDRAGDTELRWRIA